MTIDDGTWSLQARLIDETFITCSDEVQLVRYRVKLLGQGIPISECYPQDVLVNIPPSIRGFITELSAYQDNNHLSHEWHKESGYFWLRLKSPQDVYCEFTLTAPIGPVAQEAKVIDPDTWTLKI